MKNKNLMGQKKPVDDARHRMERKCLVVQGICLIHPMKPFDDQSHTLWEGISLVKRLFLIFDRVRGLNNHRRNSTAGVRSNLPLDHRGGW